MRNLVVERQPLWIVLQCEAITDIDVTAAEMLKQLDTELNTKGIHFAFVELRERLQDRLKVYGLWADPGQGARIREDEARDPGAHRARTLRTGRTLRARRPAAPGAAGRAAGLTAGLEGV